MTIATQLRHAALSLVAGLLLGPAAWAVPVTPSRDAPSRDQPASPLLESAAPPRAEGVFDLVPGDTGLAALAAMSNGRWTKACHIATALLAKNVPDVDALGVFGVCSAAASDRSAADSALKRLRKVEVTPHYEPLVRGVLNLQDKAPEKARSAFESALQARPDDPLTLYFSGEALHALGRNAEAITTFKSVLKSWPRFAPALTAEARLISKPTASRDELKVALEMTERATVIEPMNLGYWRLLADLCNRTGQQERANAIALQWLRPPSPPK